MPIKYHSLLLLDQIIIPHKQHGMPDIEKNGIDPNPHQERKLTI